jgi:bacterioferritin-associated ferredoxin
MIVCNCFNVREQDIANLAAGGCCSLRSVRQATGLGSNCGKCIPHARAVLKATTGATHKAIPIVPVPDLQIAPI